MATLVLDTFTGSGNLSTHVGETGASWSKPTTPPQWFGIFSGALTGAVLTGTGEVSWASGSRMVAIPSGGVGLSGAHSIEYEFKFSNDFQGYFGFCAADGGANYHINLFADNGGAGGELEIDLNYVTAGGSSSNLGWYYAPTLAYNTLHTIRVEVAPASQKVFLNGVERITRTDASLTSGYAFIAFSQDNTVKISRFQVDGAAGPPPPPPAFWQSFAGSHEVV